MQDKYFEASEWKKVAKNLDIDDKKFVKALADAQNAEVPDKILAALKTVQAEVDKLSNAVGKPDKTVSAYFDGLKKSIANEKKAASNQKNAPVELSAAARKLLVTQTRAGLKAVLGGRNMHATIAIVGQNAALCILAEDATKAQRHLLAEAIGAQSLPKYIEGICTLENRTYTFLVKAPASGLTKKIFRSLQEQLKTRYPVATRGEDGKPDNDADPVANEGLSPEVGTDTDTKEDADADADLESKDQPAEATPPDALGAQARPETPQPPQAPPAPPPNEAAVFNSRLNTLMPRIHTAATDQRGEIVRIVKLAGAAAHARTFGQAQTLLDQAEALMRPASTQGMPASLRAAIEGWQQATDTVDGQLARLQGALAKSDDPDLVEISELGFNALSGNFRARLMAGLREMDRAEGDALRAVAARTLPVATGLREHLQKDPLVIACDTNPFGISVTVAKTLGGSVASLCSALQEVAQA